MERGIPIRSVCRSIAALRAINHSGSLSLMEIARAIDLPYPTAYRIVQTLVHEGLIECEPSRKRYRATALVQSLSVGFQNQNHLISCARPHIVAFTQRVTWPVAIVTHVGQSMMVRDSTHALTSLTFTNYGPGYTLPILESSSGHAYMAFTTDQERALILQGLEALEVRSPSLHLFRNNALMDRIRADGYATKERVPNTPYPGKTSTISAPIFESGDLVGTLTLTFFSSAMSMADSVARYATEVKAVAAQISAALDGRSSEPAAEPAVAVHPVHAVEKLSLENTVH